MVLGKLYLKCEEGEKKEEDDKKKAFFSVSIQTPFAHSMVCSYTSNRKKKKIN